MSDKRLLLLSMFGGFGSATGGGGDVSFSGALVRRSTNQTVANNDFPVVTWDVTEFDTDGYFTASDRFTIPLNGYYLFGLQIRWSAAQNGSDGVRGSGVWKNGVDPSLHQDSGYNEWPNSRLTGALMHQTPIGAPHKLVAGDYMRAHLYQYTGSASLDIEANESLTPVFWVVRLGTY